MSICWGVDSDQAATVDHFLARKLGGFETLFNIVISCRRCNNYKSQFEERMADEYGFYFCTNR